MGDYKDFILIPILLSMMLAVETTIYPIKITTGESMKCSYGERGSLTATCVNATPAYFKETPYRFDQLDETLRCLNCTLENIDQGTFDLSGNHIETLDLRNSKIRTLRAKAFIGLIFMKDLDLSYNTITTIFPSTFTGVKKVAKLNLSHNKLNSLSDNAFAELIYLKSLSLNDNEIQFISNNTFNGLVNLEELDLTNNKLSHADIFNTNLTNLKILKLRNNHIMTLNGHEFFNLTSLTLLDISWNKIKIPTITMNVEGLKSQLTKLDISNNMVELLKPAIFSSLGNLEELDMSSNQLREIPQKTLLSLHRLVTLNLAYNKMSLFQTGLFSGLPQLRILNVSHNIIEDVQITGVFNLNSLNTLDLSGNNLTDLDYVRLITRLPRLSYLDLKNNLLPCDLESEMGTFFNEDNFKYILYGDEPGEIKCTENRVKHTFQEVADSLVQKATEGGSRTAEIWIFVLISIMLILIGVLFFLEFRTYRILSYKPSMHSTSRVNLVVSEELDGTDNAFLKE